MQRLILQPIDPVPFTAAASRRVVAELTSRGQVSPQTLAAFERVAHVATPAELEAIAAAFSRAHPHLPVLRVHQPDATRPPS